LDSFGGKQSLLVSDFYQLQQYGLGYISDSVQFGFAGFHMQFAMWQFLELDIQFYSNFSIL
jgi:hypothetical protein